MSAVLPSSMSARPVPPAAAPALEHPAAAKPTTIPGAVERLALSREQLRIAMLPIPSKPKANLLGDGAGSLLSSVSDRIKSLPGATVFLGAVHDWWARHPLRTAGIVAVEATNKVLTPLAERRPLQLIFGAACVGALLTYTKSWRWILRPALFAGLLPAITSRALRELPVDAWLKVFSSIGATSARHDRASPPSDPSTPMAP